MTGCGESQSVTKAKRWTKGKRHKHFVFLIFHRIHHDEQYQERFEHSRNISGIKNGIQRPQTSILCSWWGLLQFQSNPIWGQEINSVPTFINSDFNGDRLLRVALNAQP